ncbi:MAG: hypothetical protein U0P45_15175 [Acidimicrobiales bacterium]
MGRGTKVLVAALASVAVVLPACSSGGSEGAAPAPKATAEPPGTGACDPIDPSACLLPWPNDRFTRADPSTDTGRRLDLPKAGMPANAKGVHIDPTEWDRNDGFAPASSLITMVPGLDAARSKLPPVTDIGASMAKGSPVVLVDATAGTRLAAWAELDANAADPAKRALIVQPAAALPEGHRIVVGLRGLRRDDGSRIAPSKAFAAQVADPDDTAEAAFDALAKEGVDRKDLQLAWGFTVGSAESISGRLRKMWADTTSGQEGAPPPFEVTSNDAAGAARIVRGTYQVPKFLTGDGGPGTVLANGTDPKGIARQRGTMTADFVCLVPTSATAAKPASSVVYGHGLLGSRDEVLDIGQLGASANKMFCATDWIGMSAADVPAIATSFQDLTGFRTVPDRLQQGHLAFLELGELLGRPGGFASDPAFQDPSGKPVIDVGNVAFLGASQGGILGGVPSALSDSWKQVILAVPGMGYNLLLRRSVDFDEFFPAVEENYPDELQQTLALDLLEQLWQRGENAGYAQHLTADPYPDVPAKHVMLLEAFGDHQVANVSTEKLARTLGIGRRAPTLADGRSADPTPFSGIPVQDLPTGGSGLVVWDFGTPRPPTENVPNRAGEDPHGKLADVPEALALVLSFIDDAKIIDVCGGEPCRSGG